MKEQDPGEGRREFKMVFQGRRTLDGEDRQPFTEIGGKEG